MKRLRKPSEADSPDLATLLEPYGNSEKKDAEDPDAVPASEPSAQDGES